MIGTIIRRLYSTVTSSCLTNEIEVLLNKQIQVLLTFIQISYNTIIFFVHKLVKLVKIFQKTIKICRMNLEPVLRTV